MTLTPPGAVTNSGARAFTNQLGQIALINYNRNASSYSEFAFNGICLSKISPTGPNLKGKWKVAKTKSCGCGCS